MVSIFARRMIDGIEEKKEREREVFLQSMKQDAEALSTPAHVPDTPSDKERATTESKRGRRKDREEEEEEEQNPNDVSEESLTYWYMTRVTR